MSRLSSRLYACLDADECDRRRPVRAETPPHSPRACTRMSGACGSGGVFERWVWSVLPPITTIPSRSTWMPSGTTTWTLPMIAQAVTSTTPSSITAWRRSTLTFPQKANAVMRAVLDQWEITNTEFGGDSDFTAIVKMIERRAGVTIGAEKKP